MSVQALWQGLRWPTAQDLLFSTKAYVAVVLALAIGFSQNLQNPYWSALTVYVLVSQPQSGAIRSKALFRLGGTLLGGSATIALAALFGSHLGVLLIAALALIVVTLYCKTLDRTPASYFWFATSLTVAVIGVVHVQTPDQIWSYGTARMGEISLAIICMGVVDAVVAPRAMTPAFVEAMREWRDEAGQWTAMALAPDASDAPEARRSRRQGLRAIAAKAAPLDAQGVQLPWDVVRRPPSRRVVRLLRLLIARLMAGFASANVWLEAARELPSSEKDADLLGRVREWIGERPAFEPEPTTDHASRGEALIADLDVARTALIGETARPQLLHATMLERLQALIGDWTALEQALCCTATGTPLPVALSRVADRARPVRSIDYLAGMLDIMPLVLSFGLIVLVWFWTAWTGALTALVFTYVVAGFIIGTPGSVASARGEALWLSLSFAFTFLYQFVVLPRVTAFPVLIAVLGCALLPLGLLMAMAPAGLLIGATIFGFLGLQNAYSADFESSLQSLAGSLTGCVVAIGALHLCSYDQARFRARRLARALRRDVAEAALAVPVPALDRYLSLGADRLSLYLAATADLAQDDPLRRSDLIADLRTGGNLILLRASERVLCSPAAEAVRDLRREIARSFAGGGPIERGELCDHAEQVYDRIVDNPPSLHRHAALAALTGLRLALRPDPLFAGAEAEERA